MQPTLTQGTPFYNPNTGANEGTVQFDTQTGKRLAPGATTTQNPITPTGLSTTSQENTQNSGVDTSKLAALGLTGDQIAKLNSPEGLDQDSFQTLLGNVQDKLKYNNSLMDQRALIMKHLFDSPLTSSEKAQLPQDVQNVLAQGKDAAELQLRVINDQLQGRAQTLDSSIHDLTAGYQASLQDAEDKKTAAEGNIQNYLDMYGSSAVPFLKAKYPDAASVIDKLSNVATLAERAKNSSGGSGGSGSGSGTGVSGLGDDASNFFAQMAITGVSPNTLVPSLGTGAAAVSAKSGILNNIAKNAKTLGIDGATFGAMLTDSKAKNTAYNQLQKVGAQTQVNESTANANFQQLVGLSKKLDKSTLSSSIPLLNSWLRTGQVALGDNADVNNFVALLTTTLTEYAKVVSGQTTGAGVTEAANRETQNLLSKGLSTDTIKSFADTAKQEMSNRTTSYDTALKGLFSDIQSAQDTSGGLGGGSTDAGSDSTLPSDVQNLISSNLTFSPDKKTAYIPRSVWSTLGSNMDAVLKEAENDGFKLLIK